MQFIKDIYLDSQVTIGLLSNVPASVIAVDGKGHGRRGMSRKRYAARC